MKKTRFTEDATAVCITDGVCQWYQIVRLIRRHENKEATVKAVQGNRD